MIVRAIDNNIDLVSSDALLYQHLLDTHRYDRPVLKIRPGRLSSVLAIEVKLRNLWVYICEPPDLRYPLKYPLQFFSVLDSRASKLWDWDRTPLEHMGLDLNTEQRISFPEWVSDPNFYEKLVDGDPLAIKQFTAARIYIEEENDLSTFGLLP